MANDSWISWWGVGYSAIGGIAYMISLMQDSRARYLASAHVLERLEDALRLEHVLPLLVALRGRADATRPKDCELSDAKAVHHMLIEEDILVSRSAAGHAVRNPFETRREVTTTDWFLDDGTGPRVRVEGSRTAEWQDDALEVRQDYREKPDGQGLQSLTQLFTGHKTQGYKRKENFVPVGAILTVVGELAKNTLPNTGGGARYAVRPPPKGHYYITSQPAHQLRASFERASFACRVVAAAFGGLGAFLIARKALRRYMRHRREQQARRLLQEACRQRDQRRAAAAAAAAGGAAPDGAAAAAAAGGDDRDLDTCVVCLESQSTIVYVACGHMCVCQQCSKQLKRCPVCRMASESIRVFRM